MSAKIAFHHRVEYATLRTLQGIVTLFPISWVGRAFSGILRVVFRVCWPLKRETISRLREVFGEEISVAECRRIARTSVWNLLMNFGGLFHARKMDLAYLADHLEGTAEGEAKLRRLIDKYGGIVIA